MSAAVAARDPSGRFVPTVTGEALAEALARGGRGVVEIARELGVHHASLHRAARRHGLKLPARKSRTPDFDGWKRLVMEHGPDARRLSAVTGLRVDYVRDQLQKYFLIETW